MRIYPPEDNEIPMTTVELVFMYAVYYAPPTPEDDHRLKRQITSH